jgi:hypothetical protein
MRDAHADTHPDPHGDPVDQADADAKYRQANAVAYPHAHTQGHADPHRIN